MGIEMTIVEEGAGEAPDQNASAKTLPPRIAIVDDDASIREALRSLMRSVRYNAEAFASAEEFLASEHLNDTECLILDVTLPGIDGFELQKQLNLEKRRIPIVFITANSDEASRQRALKGGAVEFLGKPVRREALFRAIQAALQP
jgi:FixJ family two-component response regulator